MNLDLKAVAVFLPYLAGFLIGLTYTMNGKVVGAVSLPTYIVAYCATAIVIMVLLHIFTPIKMNFAQLARMPVGGFAAISILSSIGAWLIALVVTREISATYAAIGEMSYPIFTAILTYFIFRSRELDWTTAIGGALILIGSVIVISDKIKIGS
jgi:drug/metabolite transporter (DMT)-like permease